ncbi:hypothetical protein Ancab_013119 [Ancistrocladus abbreviatus]
MVSREEDRAWLKGSYIGVIHPSVDLAGIQNQLSDKFGCEIRSLRGRKVLISSIKKERVERLLAEDDRRTSQWFTSLRLWNMFDVCSGRTVWLRILVHTTKLERIDERMNIRVDGALFQIKVSEEMVSSEEMMYSEAAASDGCKKIYPTLSLVVLSSPSHIEESIFNDEKELPAKPFPSTDGGLTTKQHMTSRKPRA